MTKFLGSLLSAFLLLGLSAVSSLADASTFGDGFSSGSETHRAVRAMTSNNVASSDEIRRGSGWYSGLHIGAVYQPDVEIRGSALKIDVSQDVGYVFDLVIGYKIPIGIRVETEFSYRNTDTDSMYSVISKKHLSDGIGGFEAAGGLVNAWYDFDFLFRDWYPYAGLGFGFATVWATPGHSGKYTVIDSSDTSIVGQIGTGLVYRYTPDIEISLDYRYLRSLIDYKFYYEPTYPGSNDATYQTHSFMIGFRGFF